MKAIADRHFHGASKRAHTHGAGGDNLPVLHHGGGQGRETMLYARLLEFVVQTGRLLQREGGSGREGEQK